MAQKNFMSRIALKRDTESIWHNQAKNFVPLDGEMILYKPDSEHSYYRYKIGDGTTTIVNLPFQFDYEKIENEFKPIQGVVISPEASNVYADAFIDTIAQDKYGKITATKKKVGNAAITISPGAKLTTGGSFTTNQWVDETITLNHETTTRSNTTNSETVNYGNTFNVIDTISSDATGHITAVNTKTVTMPAAVDISGKMDKENPTGTGSFSLNRKANTTIGNYSFAEGNNTIASGNYSHAEGNYTDATGESSHAEGYKTRANGAYSHAEGSGAGEGTTEDTVIHAAAYPDFLTETVRLYSTRADGTNAHAEGYRTYAYGNNTHSEGMETIAFGKNSHAENQQTVASGNNSHAEGFKTAATAQGSHAEGAGTTASGDYQHVQGKYNLANSDLAHIIGNGTSKALPSNAHTIDWQGNAWFAGDVYVGSTSGTNRDEGSVKLVKSGDTELILTSSTPNSTKKFKITIDDNGVLTTKEVTE